MPQLELITCAIQEGDKLLRVPGADYTLIRIRPDKMIVFKENCKKAGLPPQWAEEYGKHEYQG